MAPCSSLVLVPVSAITAPLPYREHAIPLAAAATIRQPAITGFPDRVAIAPLEFSCAPLGPSLTNQSYSLAFTLPLALSSSPTMFGVTPVSVTAYRRQPPLAFLYGASASVTLSVLPSMASQSIPLITFSKRSPPYDSQHVKLPVSCSRMMMFASI
jgi:hypothetical protein